jgi:predicted choloylglycine hydrolase
MQSNKSFKLGNVVVIAVMLSIIFLFGCVSKKNIKVPLSDPLPHPKLAQMQSLSIEKRDGVTYFGKSRKYKKRGITVVSLKGDPYEMGYAHGVLLKEEMLPWIREAIYWAKTQSFGTSLLENTIMDRAREVEQYIPDKYITELKGLAAGSGIDYEFLMALNTVGTTARSFWCTSVAVKRQDGKLIRSRSYENVNLLQNHRPANTLFIYQPSQGYAFASLSSSGFIGVGTAMNETGLNFGQHAIWKAPNDWKGMPNSILNRKIIENANSVEDVGEILKKAPRSRPQIIMVTDSKKARIYEYDSENIGYKDMDEDRLILTNYTQVLKIGTPYLCQRYHSASNFLDNYQNEMDVSKLVELNRSDSISRMGAFDQIYSIHLAIFIPETLDFWIAVDPPPASRGRWVGFNLKKELDGSGHEPNPLIIPAMSDVTTANIKVNEKEPWTGKWKVESTSRGGGIWAMKQEGEIVKSTRSSAYEFKGKVKGNQLKGKLVGASGTYDLFTLEMPSDSMSFTGTADIATSGTNHLKGKRIE